MRTDLGGLIMNSFTFVDRQHPFYSHICSFKDLSLSHLDSLTKTIHAAAEAKLNSYIRGGFAKDQGWTLKQLYLSIQYRNQLEPLPFNALSFFYSGHADRIECYEFPRDPSLTSIAALVEAESSRRIGQGRGWDVLSYAPSRRLTFLRHAPDGAPVVGKFLHRSVVEDAYRKLCEVSIAAKRAPCNFSVAAPVRIEHENNLFYQEARPGANLAALLNRENFVDLLYHVGTIHRDLHGLEVADARDWDFGSFQRHLTTVIQWISFFRPDQAAFLAEVRDLLLKGAPRVDPGSYTFCHGDYGCPQILKENGNWSVVDFDRCMRADPHMEIGRLIAYLKKNVPLFRGWFMEPEWAIDGLEEAYESYLRGYEERAGQRLDRKKVLWYRICYEIHYLARLFKRDRYKPVAFDRAIELIRDLSRRFALRLWAALFACGISALCASW